MSILIKNVVVNGEEKDILVEGNKISEIAYNIQQETEHQIDGKNMVALPPFINAHTHAAMTLMRGYADDLLLDDWLQNKIWPFEAKITENDVFWGTKLACLEMIKSGSTFFNDMYWHYHGTARAVEEMGIRAAVSAVFIDGFDKEKAKQQIRLNEQLYHETKRYSERINFALGPHAIYTVSEESLIWAKEFSEENNIMIHIHISETQNEVEDCIQKHGKRPIEYLQDIGLLSSNVLAAHVIWVNEREMQILKEYNVKIAHNPTSNMKLCSGFFPYKELKKYDLSIALGTDGCASNNNLDMLEEMKIAALLHKIKSNDTTIMSANEAYKMATINGAKIFNLNCGEIKEGALADFILVDLNDVNLVPNHNLISNMVYSANRSCIDTVICDGKILMQDGKVEGEEEIIAKVSEVVKDLM